MAKATPKSKCLKALQLLRRLESADDHGYCSCASCGEYNHYKQMDGGHFIAKGCSSFWALEEENVHPQCKGCNGFGMKNGVAAYQYQKFMVRKYGQEFVDNMIETRRDVKKRFVADYADMLKDLNARIKIEQDRVGG